MQIALSYTDHLDSPNNLSVHTNHRFCGQQYDDGLPLIDINSHLSRLLESSRGEYEFVESYSKNSEYQNSTITVKEMVDKIRSVFGLNAVQVASLVGISRPSLYNHISEKENPKDLNAYKKIYDLALRIETEVSDDLKRGLKTVLVEGKTLLQHLKQRPLDADRIIFVAKQVQSKLSTSEKSASNLSTSEQRIKSRTITKAG